MTKSYEQEYYVVEHTNEASVYLHLKARFIDFPNRPRTRVTAPEILASVVSTPNGLFRGTSVTRNKSAIVQTISKEQFAAVWERAS